MTDYLQFLVTVNVGPIPGEMMMVAGVTPSPATAPTYVAPGILKASVESQGVSSFTLTSTQKIEGDPIGAIGPGKS